MGASTDFTVTPRPIYHADGRKSPDCYTHPPELHDELTGRARRRSRCSHYWGPTAGIASSRWIADAAARSWLDASEPDLLLVYLPHLDYDLQRYGPEGPEAERRRASSTRSLAPLLDARAAARRHGGRALASTGSRPRRRPVDINRALRRAGLLDVYTQAGMEYLDPWTSRAFAVADHQIAHVYVRDPAD